VLRRTICSATALQKKGGIKKSFEYYDVALKLKPNFREAREYLGEAYLQDGILAKAVQQYIMLQKTGAKNARVLLDSISDFVNKQS
jgi:tetratricopeptide (TPR) repeat protein